VNVWRYLERRKPKPYVHLARAHGDDLSGGADLEIIAGRKEELILKWLT
jgi:hypothetical protein